MCVETIQKRRSVHEACNKFAAGMRRRTQPHWMASRGKELARSNNAPRTKASCDRKPAANSASDELPHDLTYSYTPCERFSAARKLIDLQRTFINHDHFISTWPRYIHTLNFPSRGRFQRECQTVAATARRTAAARHRCEARVQLPLTRACDVVDTTSWLHVGLQIWSCTHLMHMTWSCMDQRRGPHVPCQPSETQYMT